MTLKEPPLERRLCGSQSEFERCRIKKYPFSLLRIEPLFLGRPSRGLVAIHLTVLRLLCELFNYAFRVENK
jgi:hypothetical protein